MTDLCIKHIPTQFGTGCQYSPEACNPTFVPCGSLGAPSSKALHSGEFAYLWSPSSCPEMRVRAPLGTFSQGSFRRPITITARKSNIGPQSNQRALGISMLTKQWVQPEKIAVPVPQASLHFSNLKLLRQWTNARYKELLKAQATACAGTRNSLTFRANHKLDKVRNPCYSPVAFRQPPAQHQHPASVTEGCLAMPEYWASCGH